MQKTTIFLVTILASGLAQATSFDCSKASNDTEQLICSDSLLGELDEVLSDNYKKMLNADIGEGAKKDLKSTQRKWLSERNKLTNTKHIELSYRIRIDEICEYPVISGVHPICTASDDVDIKNTPTEEANQEYSREEIPNNTPSQSAPENVTVILAQLFEGESLFNQGKYSQLQIDAIFDQNFKNKEVLVSGEITNIAKSISGEKYISLKVTDGHFFDIYPSEDFNVLDYNKGQQVSFVGKWVEIGSGIVIHHVIRSAIIQN